MDCSVGRLESVSKAISSMRYGDRFLEPELVGLLIYGVLSFDCHFRY